MKLPLTGTSSFRKRGFPYILKPNTFYLQVYFKMMTASIRKEMIKWKHIASYVLLFMLGSTNIFSWAIKPDKCVG